MALGLILSSLLLQGLVVLQLLSGVHQVPSFWPMCRILALQGLAAALAAPAALSLMPARFQTGGARTLLYLWSFCSVSRWAGWR